ncbi:MAG: glycosyl transferase family 1 [Alphaproteobacteria bacterium]
MRIAYFAHDIADAAVQKRLRMLHFGGGAVVLLGFERRRLIAPMTGAPVFVLGHTASGKFGQRALSVLAALPRAWEKRKHWARADVILARNLEMLAIACILAPLAGARARIVYECLDIHRVMLRNDLIGFVMRSLERGWLKRTSALLTSSPAFIDNYFKPRQRYKGKTILAENKVLEFDTAPSKSETPAGPPWKIAWCGVLRCARSFDVLSQIAATENGAVEIELWGAPALDQIPDFHARLKDTPHMTFQGAYRPADLSRIYGGAQFVWALDYFEAGGNSAWLLPNRLYEGLYHGAVPIAAAHTETARWLDAHQVGVVLAEPLAATLQAFLRDAAPKRYAALRQATAALDPHLLAFTREDCRDLVATL